MGLVKPIAPAPLTELGRVHFAGIGGAGMSGIARIMLARGVRVSGSDSAWSAQLDELAALGARVHVGHATANLGDSDTLVVSTAIRADNPELAEAARRGIRVLHRAAALASVMLGRQGIAVAGTHGKTTTTAMLTTVLRWCDADPSYVIGGILAETGLGAYDGSGSAFVAEADESDGSFLMLSPRVAVVTSIEADHLDNYENLAQIEAAFAAFAGKIGAGGLLIACADDPGALALAGAARQLPIEVRTYGESAAADYRLTSVTPRGMATTLTVTARPRAGTSPSAGADPGTGRRAGGTTGSAAADGVTIEIAVPGRHNALNAAAAFAAAVESGFASVQVAAGLAAYRGAQRRLELKGEADGVRVLDSYAHHPTEIAADLAAVREVAGGGRIITIFQPHLYSRTRIFAADFGAALGRSDEALVLDVYAAREDPEPGVCGMLVAAAVPGSGARFLPDRAGVPAAVASTAKPGDVVITMGAGDVTALGPAILAELAERGGERG